jgi:peptidoglycan/xylan/chitin deacetylase (PgdA/CDA1 family)
VKTPFAWLLYALGVTRFAAWWHRKYVVILNYHGICENNGGSTAADLLDLNVSAESFRSQISYLKRRYHVISLREFLAATAEGRQLPDYSVVLTFDDGYRNFLTVAPLLLEHSLPATLFLVTDRMSQNDVDSEATKNQADTLSWSEVQSLARHDVFDFGSHTCSHPSLTGLTPESVDHELRESLNELRQRLQRVVPALAYPNGAYAGLSIEEIRSAGYACALTIDAGPNKPGVSPYFLRRQTILGQDNKQMFAARLSCLTSWLYRLREMAQAFVNRIKSAVFPPTSSLSDGKASAEVERS